MLVALTLQRKLGLKKLHNTFCNDGIGTESHNPGNVHVSIYMPFIIAEIMANIH